MNHKQHKHPWDISWCWRRMSLSQWTKEAHFGLNHYALCGGQNASLSNMYMYAMNMQECRHSCHSDCTRTKLIIATAQMAHTATTPPTGDLQSQYPGVAMSFDFDYVRASISAHKTAAAPAAEWTPQASLIRFVKPDICNASEVRSCGGQGFKKKSFSYKGRSGINLQIQLFAFVDICFIYKYLCASR